MSTCYKCGRELAGGNECEPDCQSAERQRLPIITKGDIHRMQMQWERDSVAVDWDKVQTLEDLKLIVRHLGMNGDDRVHRQSPLFQELKRFLKDEQP